MNYDEKLEADIKRYTDEPEYLWEYTYNNLNAELKRNGLNSASTKWQAIENIEALIDELIDTMYYIKDEVKENDLA